MNKLDQFFEKATTPANYAKDYNQYLVSILSAIEGDAFNDYIQLLLDVAKAGKTIYIIGNGGSAATASPGEVGATRRRTGQATLPSRLYSPGSHLYVALELRSRV